MATMASANDDAAAMLREYAELLSITGGDPFRARNYEKAAKAVGGYPGDLAKVPDAALTKIDGVGSSIAGRIIDQRRPMRSDTHPQKGRVNPFRSRSTVMASTSAVIPKATTTLSTWYEEAMGLSCAVTTKPPKASMTIIT